MSDPSPSKPTMYCRTCGYVLDGLGEPRCPECGRAFDSADRRTYRVRPRRRRWWIIGPLLVMLVACGWLAYKRIVYVPSTVRVRFDPDAKTKGFTSWTRLFPLTLPNGRVIYTSVCNVQIGGQFPVQLDGDVLFNVRMTDGDDDAIQIEVSGPKVDAKQYDLARDESANVSVDGKSFKLTYSTSHVNRGQPAVQSYATIRVTHEP